MKPNPILVPILLAASLVACGGPPTEPAPGLVARFEARVDDGVAERRVLQGVETVSIRTEDEARLLRAGNSHRLAVSTWEGVARETTLTLSDATTLSIEVAAMPPLGGPFSVDNAVEHAQATARLRLVDDDTGSTLVEESATIGGAWAQHRVELPAVESGRLILDSTGAAPVAWAGFYSPTPEVARDDRPPNLVLVVIDTLRADHLSLYGYDQPTSPRLDAFAEQAHVFEHALSASTWTLPSTASLLTGLLPAQHGLRTVHDALADEVETVTERLRANGYRTAAITDGGFLDPRWGFEQGFDRYDVTRGRAWQEKDAAVIADGALDWFETNLHEPYFLLIHTYETHQPYVNPEGYADPFFDGAAPARSPSVGPDSILRSYANVPVTPPTPLVESNRRLYNGEIRRADHYLGEVLDLVMASRAADRTAILITSDHGEEFLEHGNVEHGLGKVFDINVRVPMILRLPGQQAGTRQATPVTGIDVAPTLLDLAGLEPLTGPGRSLRELVEQADPGRPVVVEGFNSFPQLNEHRLRLDEGPITLVRDMVRQRTFWFDRAADPGLTRPSEDLTDPRIAPLIARMQAMLAWTGEGQMVVRLDAGPARVTAAAESRVVPVGAWAGFDWRPATPIGEGDGGVGVELDAEDESYLVFDLRPGGGAWILEATGADASSWSIELSTRDSESKPLVWDSASRDLPEPGVVFPTWAVVDPTAAEMTPEATRELKALGYLGD